MSDFGATASNKAKRPFPTLGIDAREGSQDVRATAVAASQPSYHALRPHLVARAGDGWRPCHSQGWFLAHNKLEWRAKELDASDAQLSGRIGRLAVDEQRHLTTVYEC